MPVLARLRGGSGKSTRRLRISLITINSILSHSSKLTKLWTISEGYDRWYIQNGQSKSVGLHTMGRAIVAELRLVSFLAGELCAVRGKMERQVNDL